MHIAYLNYGAQSGVTRNVRDGLLARGHEVSNLTVEGPLLLRDPGSRRPRLTPGVMAHLAISALHFGRRALDHRYNTAFAWDVHSQNAERLLQRMPRKPQVVLQNGGLFSPRSAGRLPYVLYVDHTSALAMREPPRPEAGLPAPIDFGTGWRHRERSLYQGARAIATFSRHAQRSLIDDYFVPALKIEVVGCGANVFPDQVERCDDGHTLLFVGKGDFRAKGGKLLLEAFRRLRAGDPSARLLLVGPTEPLELPEGAVNLGLVPIEDLPKIFAQASAFVLPTLREPFGIAFLDAMACGVPCIGSDIEAVPEILEDGRAGLLARAGSAESLLQSMRRMLSDRAGAREMGARGREKVARFYRWELVAERVEKILRAASEKPIARRRSTRTGRELPIEERKLG